MLEEQDIFCQLKVSIYTSMDLCMKTRLKQALMNLNIYTL